MKHHLRGPVRVAQRPRCRVEGRGKASRVTATAVIRQEIRNGCSHCEEHIPRRAAGSRPWVLKADVGRPPEDGNVERVFAPGPRSPAPARIVGLRC